MDVDVQSTNANISPLHTGGFVDAEAARRGVGEGGKMWKCDYEVLQA
jgi:hypothetical protein